MRRISFTVGFVLSLVFAAWLVAPLFSDEKDCPLKCKIVACWRYRQDDKAGTAHYRYYESDPFEGPEYELNKTCHTVPADMYVDVDPDQAAAECKQDSMAVSMKVFSATSSIHCKQPTRASWAETHYCYKGIGQLGTKTRHVCVTKSE